MKSSLREEITWLELARLPERLGLESLRVSVACGGVGPERTVSLASGRAVCEALGRRLKRCRLLDVQESGGRRLKSLLRGSDLVFIALHGHYGEDGGFQQALEDIGMLYTGSGVAASQAAFDKRLSKRLFARGGIATPRALLLSGPDELEPHRMATRLGRALGMPLVIKPACSGSSIGVSIVHSAEALPEAFEAALAASPSSGRGIVAEEYIRGREVTVSILAGRALPVIRLLLAREFYDYVAKYHDERTRYEVPAALDDGTTGKIQAAAIGAFEALGCRDYGRVDMMLSDDGQAQVLEVNTIPGMTSHSLLPKAAQAVGFDFTTLVSIMAALAVRRKG